MPAVDPLNPYIDPKLGALTRSFPTGENVQFTQSPLTSMAVVPVGAKTFGKSWASNADGEHGQYVRTAIPAPGTAGGRPPA